MVDWPTYNESLVRRVQVLLDFDVVDRWDLELSQMNLGKVGEEAIVLNPTPSALPDSGYTSPNGFSITEKGVIDALNTISRFIQRHSSLFTTSEERLMEGKRCLKVFL
jgi:hypothetical protein